jgi:hypothetical protein
MDVDKHVGVVDRERGQAIGLVLIAITLVVVIALAVVSVSTRMVQRSRAQTAADAAALAGVDGGMTGSGAAASRNGAQLVAWTRSAGADGERVTVEVVLGGEHAVASASNSP